MTFPTSSTGLTLRLDAASAVLSAVSADVPAVEFTTARRWTDSVGSGQFNQSTSANRPLWGAKQINAQPGLLFWSADKSMTSSIALSSVVAAGAFELAVVVRVDAATANSASQWLNDCIICDESGYFGLFVRNLAGVPTLYAYCWDGAAKVLSRTLTLGKTHVVYFRKASGTNYLSMDGDSETSVACGNIAVLTGALALGNRAAIGARFTGVLAEGVCFNAARNSGDRASDIAYLIAKYNPVSLAPGYSWTSTLVLSGGRLDSIADLGGGALLSASRTPTPARVYGSSSYGSSWSLYETVGTVDLNTIDHDPTATGVAYMLDRNSRLHKTANYGDTWTDLGQVSSSTPITDYPRSYALLVIHGTGTVLVADTAASGGKIFRSTTGGTSFTDLGAIAVGGIYRFVATGDGVICCDTSGRIYKSTNDGATWTSKGQLLASEIWAIVYAGNGVCLVASESGQIFRSTDNGENWSAVVTLDGGADDMAVHGSTVIYSTYTSNKRIYISDDAGLNWYLLRQTLPTASGDSLEHVITVNRRFVGVTNLGYVMTSNQGPDLMRPMRQCPQCLGVGVIA